MKKISKRLILVSAIGLFIVGCNSSPERFANKIASKVAKKLELTDVQKLKLDKIKAAMLAEHKERTVNREAHQKVFEKIILADQLNKDDLKTLISKKKNKFEGKFDKYFPLIEDFHASLSLDQKQKLVKLSEKMHKKHGKRRH